MENCFRWGFWQGKGNETMQVPTREEKNLNTEKLDIWFAYSETGTAAL